MLHEKARGRREEARGRDKECALIKCAFIQEELCLAKSKTLGLTKRVDKKENEEGEGGWASKGKKGETEDK